ncbi:tryptophan synthase subunit beta [Atopomonas sediminilitoris]|uniref:tryptophan synthase subunit beta n=1 Tax=Atopomonas sediminilitoris TaxID=2919919 RepID=UPI001F4E69AE|nr:tryptophan synthase subunit beta [Atopomonas sediminilitoris]MCJ8168821.1 tryptophan synthase subunit beta [Atopomonas sediminilitoris]
MLFIQRDAQQQICHVSASPSYAEQECLPEDDPQVLAWLRDNAKHSLRLLQDSDLDLVRVLEDVVDVLINKGHIRYTDLPEAARNKLSERAKNRATVNGLNRLLSDDDGGLI